jgi:hypothetical protein
LLLWIKNYSIVNVYYKFLIVLVISIDEIPPLPHSLTPCRLGLSPPRSCVLRWASLLSLIYRLRWEAWPVILGGARMATAHVWGISWNLSRMNLDM